MSEIYNYKWSHVTPADAKVFHSVPMKPDQSRHSVPDSSPNATLTWRDGIKIKRERIPSMVNGQTGFGRCRKHTRKGPDILDIIIEKERKENHIKDVTICSHVTVGNCKPMDAPKVRKRKKRRCR